MGMSVAEALQVGNQGEAPLIHSSARFDEPGRSRIDKIAQRHDLDSAVRVNARPGRIEIET